MLRECASELRYTYSACVDVLPFTNLPFTAVYYLKRRYFHLHSPCFVLCRQYLFVSLLSWRCAIHNTECVLEGPGFHPGKGEQYFSSRNHSDKLCGSSILLLKVYRFSFLVVKQPEHEASHSSPHHPQTTLVTSPCFGAAQNVAA